MVNTERLESIQADLHDLVVELHPEYPVLAASTMALIQLISTQLKGSHPNAKMHGMKSLLYFRSAILVHASMVPKRAQSSVGFGALLDLHSWLEDRMKTVDKMRPIILKV